MPSGSTWHAALARRSAVCSLRRSAPPSPSSPTPYPIWASSPRWSGGGQSARSELPPEPLASALAAGLRYVSLSPHLVAVLLRCVLYTVPIVAVPALMPIVARDLLG